MKKIAIGCASVAILTMAIVVALGVWLFRELPVLSASLSIPSTAQLDSELTLTVTATNPHQDTIVLDSIDIDDAFLEGFQIIEIQPAPEGTMHIFGMRSWEFGLAVSPGDSQDIQFKLKAVKEGHFSGDVDVCNPNQDFVTLLADTVVRPGTSSD